MSKSAKVYLVYVVLGLIPVFLDLVVSPKLDGTLVTTITTLFPYPLYMGFALVGFLGLKLNQNRLLFSVLLFLGISYALLNPLLLNSWSIGKMGLNFVIAMGFPLTLALVYSLRETRIMDFQNLGRLLMSLIPLIALGFILAHDVPGFKKIAYYKFFPLEGFLLPQLALVSLAIFALVVILNKDSKIKPFIKVVGISLIPMMSAVWAGLKTGPTVTDPSLHMVAAFTVICAIQLHAIFRMYWHRVYMDELTDIPNRRALDELFPTLSGEYALAMMDIDHFKAFNDNYGHDEGDNVLRLVGRVLSEELGEKVYRYGGEEFCAVFKGITAEDAFMYANKIRRKLEEREFVIRGPNSKREPTSSSDRRKPKRNGAKKVQVTISIGLASPCRDIKTATDVLKLADQALYQAKKKGRNCVVVWETEAPKASSNKKKKSSSVA